MVSKKERRILQLLSQIQTLTPTWEAKLDALGDLIREVGPIRIKDSDGMTYRLFIDNASQEVRLSESLEVEINHQDQTAAAIRVLNMLYDKGELL